MGSGLNNPSGQYWVCVNKDCPKKAIPVWAKRKPDCTICRKPLKEDKDHS